MIRICALIILTLSFSPVAFAATFDHSGWNTILQQHVKSVNDGKATEVDYKGVASDRQKLQTYLSAVAGVDETTFAGWSKPDQLAFLINAYNGWTVELILTKYPDLDSIKDLGSLFKSPWKKKFIPLFGKNVSLDDIEHGLIRAPGSYDDPRIHFAVNCASIGCPALRAEAYRGEILESQLKDAEMLFLSDTSRNRFSSGVFEMSSIFKWYGDDFRKGYLGIDSLEGYLLSHGELLGLISEEQDTLGESEVKLSYLKYDWKLNDVASP